ncbi:MAG: hypothetical protein WAV28_13760 [Sedimentisphaerales bacterium]
MYVSIEVPEIKEYSIGFPQYWLKALFIGPISLQFQINALATTYIRLVEAALAEYRLGQSKLKEFWDTHDSLNLAAMYRAVSHFESCLSDMHRAINCFTRLRRHRDLPEGLRLALNEQKPRFIADQISDQLRLIRNDIHHLEELVMDGRLQEGQAIALKPDGPETPHPTEPNQTIKTIDRLVIAQREVKFSDLATWLTEMGRFAEKIASYETKQTA